MVNRLRHDWAHIDWVARERGLHHAFAMELFSVGRDVEHALATNRRADVQNADRNVRGLKRRLLDTLPKDASGAQQRPGSPSTGRWRT